MRQVIIIIVVLAVIGIAYYIFREQQIIKKFGSKTADGKSQYSAEDIAQFSQPAVDPPMEILELMNLGYDEKEANQIFNSPLYAAGNY